MRGLDGVGGIGKGKNKVVGGWGGWSRPGEAMEMNEFGKEEDEHRGLV